ncbi:MAG: hypothetical protein ABSA92_16390 [Candidatus Bathyarchaeia archaeon]
MLFYGAAAAGTGTTIKWMADEDVPSTPSRHDVTERTTVITHYPGGRVEGDSPSSEYLQYRKLSADNETETDRKVRSVRYREGWNEGKIAQIVSEHLAIERHLQRDYAEAIAKNVSDYELNHKYFWAHVALHHGKRYCE